MTEKRFIREERETEIKGEYDVIVVGGGPSGITAALSSSNSGLRTLLIERYGFLGGMATAGLVGSFCGFFTTGPEKKRIVGGIADRILESLKINGGISVKRASRVNPKIGVYSFNPEVFKYVAEDCIVRSGVEILYHTCFVDIIWEIKRKKLSGVIVENKSGRMAFLGRLIIDATGDGDVAYRAEVPFEKGNQAMTTIFRLTHLDIQKMLELNLKEVESRLLEAKKTGKYSIDRVDGIINPSLPSGNVTVNITNIAGLDGTDIKGLTSAEIEGRRQVFQYLMAFRDFLPGFKEAEVVAIAPQVGIRETRRFSGEYTLNEHEVLYGKKPDTLVALGAWPVEIHNPETKRVDWRFLEKEDDYYGIPVGCIIPKGIDNLLITGRCISTTHIAHASARVMAQAFALGEASGVVAYESLISGIPPKDVDVKRVKKELRKRGAILEA